MNLKKEKPISSTEENPYLNARRTWNSHTGAAVASKHIWQIIGIVGLLIGLAGVGGMIHIGSQSKFVPYVVEVNKLGQAVAVAPAHLAAKPELRVIHASVAAFIADLRMVSPDVALQRKAVFRAYAMLSTDDPATAKTNEWYNATEDSSPFKRATTEMVGVEIESAMPQTADTWQVDWAETTRDRQGTIKGKPVHMRALVTLYIVPPKPETTEEQIRSNPLGIYIRDYSWSKQG